MNFNMSLSTYDEGRWGNLRGATTTIVNGTLYLLGGYGITNNVKVPNLWVLQLDLVDLFNETNPFWQIKAPAVMPCDHHVTVLYNGHLHTLGGDGESISVEVLGTSTFLPNELPRAFMDAVAWKDVLATCTRGESITTLSSNGQLLTLEPCGIISHNKIGEFPSRLYGLQWRDWENSCLCQGPFYCLQSDPVLAVASYRLGLWQRLVVFSLTPKMDWEFRLSPTTKLPPRLPRFIGCTMSDDGNTIILTEQLDVSLRYETTILQLCLTKGDLRMQKIRPPLGPVRYPATFLANSLAKRNLQVRGVLRLYIANKLTTENALELWRTVDHDKDAKLFEYIEKFVYSNWGKIIKTAEFTKMPHVYIDKLKDTSLKGAVELNPKMEEALRVSLTKFEVPKFNGDTVFQANEANLKLWIQRTLFGSSFGSVFKRFQQEPRLFTELCQTVTNDSSLVYDMELSTFTCFSNLPFELRERIWIEAHPPSQEIFVFVDNGVIKTNLAQKFVIRSGHLHVNKEARNTFLSRYSHIFANEKCGTPISIGLHFNDNTDTLCLWKSMQDLYKLQTHWPQVMSKVKYLDLDIHIFRQPDDQFCPLSFKGMEALELVTIRQLYSKEKNPRVAQFHMSPVWQMVYDAMFQAAQAKKAAETTATLALRLERQAVIGGFRLDRRISTSPVSNKTWDRWVSLGCQAMTAEDRHELIDPVSTCEFDLMPAKSDHF